MSFYELVENIDTLAIDEQFELMQILQNKLKDKLREDIYNNWLIAKSEINNGNFKLVEVKDFINEIETK